MKKLRIVCLVLSAVCFCGVVFGDGWSGLSSMSTNLYFPHAGAINGMLYVAGGDDGATFGGPVATVRKYDPVTDVWTVLSGSMPQPWYYGNSGVIGNKLYIAGGDGGAGPTSTLHIFDAITETWSYGASMPITTLLGASAGLNGLFYVYSYQPATTSDAFYVYNPGCDSWTLLSSPNFQHDVGAGVAANGKFYIMGGFDNGTMTTAVEMYDPLTDVWTVVPGGLSVARTYLTAEVLNGKIYVVGGYDGTALDTVDVYDPVLQTWNLASPKVTGVYGHGTGVIGYKLYAVVGNNHSSTLSILEVYEADCNYSLLGDHNGDCINNLVDLALMAQTWLVDCNQLPLDVNCVPL